MIDFHNHILPNVDDGSKSIEMSLNMLKTAQEYGTTDVINTVHFQHPKMEFIDTSYDFIVSETEKLQSSLYKNDINIKIHTGSEVFFNYNLMDILDNPITTIGNGKYMLIEFQTYQFPKDYDQVLYDLAIHGVTPIIAHPERYREIQNEIDIIKKLIDSGCLIQLDAGSVLGHFGEKCMEISFEMLKRSMVHFIGSDAHNDKKRSFAWVIQ